MLAKKTGLSPEKTTRPSRRTLFHSGSLDESEFYLANRANRPLETSPRPIYLISWRNMYRNSQSRQYTTPRTTRRHATHDTNAAHELCLGCV